MSASRVVLVCCVMLAFGTMAGYFVYLRWPSESATGPAASDQLRGEPLSLSAAELLAEFTDRSSAFLLDVTVDRFDGGTYRPGEKLIVTGTTERDGFLYLFRTDPDGSTRLIFPLSGQDNRVSSAQRFRVPAESDRRDLAVPATEGTYHIKAVVTRIRLQIRDSKRVVPAQPAAHRPRLLNGALAWDEVLFHVEAAGGKKSASGN